MYFTEIPADWFHLLRRRGHSDWWQGQLGQKVNSLHYPDILFWLGLLAPFEGTMLDMSCCCICYCTQPDVCSFFLSLSSWVLQVVLPLVPGTFWKLWFAEAWKKWTEMGAGLCNLPKAWLMVSAVTVEGGKTLWKVWGKVCFQCRNSLSLFSTRD